MLLDFAKNVKYICNKCENIHSKLFINHKIYNLDKEIKDIFTGICKEEGHLQKLYYFCKTHNNLCCAACLSKNKSKGNGQHSECDVYNIEDIRDEKISILKENIKLLEKLSITFQQSINEFKKI